MGAQLSIVGTDPNADAGPQIDFETFWMVWEGKKTEKKLCRIIWERMLGPQQAAAIEASLVWRSHWLRQEWEYLPNPKTWLNGDRWEDVPPKTLQTQAQKAFAPDEARPKGALSQFAKDAIAAIVARQKGHREQA